MITLPHFCDSHIFVVVVVWQLLKHGSTAVPLEPIVLWVTEAAERRGLRQLSRDGAQALELLLSEVGATSSVAASKTQTSPRITH